MTLTITAITNHDTPYLNTLTLLTDDGKYVVLDRQCTEYTYDKITGRMTMDWVNLYIWDGETENYNIPDDIFDNAIVTKIEVEDDAPAGYTFRPITVEKDGVSLPILS